MDENDDYDDLRKRNIAERNAIFAEFFKELKEQTNDIKELKKIHNGTENSENEPPKKRRRTISHSKNDRVRMKYVKLEFRKKYNTRSRSRNISQCEEEEKENDIIDLKSNKPKLQVLFPWAKPFQRSIDLMKMGVCDVDEEEEQRSISSDDGSSDDLYDITKKRIYNVNRAPYDPNNIPSVSEITDEMLDNIATKSTSKQYCKINGTCCHQCRQKTLDTKTVCRSGECIGLRGQFCGPCLKGRYGESAVDALKDPNWVCPPCRGLCNCSICRTRSGLPPTGILAPIVKEEGFSSVMDYLQSAETDDT
ncbi:cell division cycle-associated protein 7 isoform X1 [Bombus impatiens]|uniref:Cell division cycle-associated protein 7 isoform X1 n=1 Tax=Bombus impatiens TaxID=132113 RepID=A0A6P6F8K1_BOMIM|nr:cell division cycle-associated protein 7 isoform X1 [Bombus impatiens]XP_024221227.1 cell division cycle-associated protein 7 isoform X1 [Bombus impatiens]